MKEFIKYVENMEKIKEIHKYRKHFENWLYDIAFNNKDQEEFVMYIEEIISRLDGLEVYIYEKTE